MDKTKQHYVVLADGSIDFTAWLETHCANLSPEYKNLLHKAYALSNTACKGHVTFYGEPYLEQCLAMAEIIIQLKLDPISIAAAVISSAVQYNDLPLETITEQVSPDVAKLVSGVLQMSAIRKLQNQAGSDKRSHGQIDKLRKMLLAMVSDVRAVIIKLAKQAVIMRGIRKLPADERKRIALETLDIYSPLANRLGIGQIKWELEDLAFHYIDPHAYKNIVRLLAARREDREQHIHETIAIINSNLAIANVHADVVGRAKHIYSIYRKMQRKHVEYQEIYDANAIRILVPTINDCYTVLSIVHGLWEHIPEEFDDYITHPKPNGYRSIHTAVIGPQQKNLEVQIRTPDMDEEAELGVAAHWLYKEGATHPSGYEAKIAWLRQLVDWHKDVAHSGGVPEGTYDPVLEDCVYIFTPAGDIIDLPIQSTPLDFAYHIHSNVGHRCRGAKVNGSIVPLSYQLRTGDRVEILTVRDGAPSRDWLNPELAYLKTTRARAKVAQWFKQQDIEQYLEEGRHILEREFQRAGLPHVHLDAIAKQLNFKNEQALLISVGHGNVRPAQILQIATRNLHPTETSEQSELEIISATGKMKPSSRDQVRIEGVGNLLTRTARCCKPIPGDAIIGYITQGRGVTIHRQDCSNMAHLEIDDQKRILPVNWEGKLSGAYYVDVRIRAYDRLDLLRDISTTLANVKIHLIGINTSINKNLNTAYTTLTVEIQDAEQLQQLLSQLNQLPSVIDAKRLAK